MRKKFIVILGVIEEAKEMSPQNALEGSSLGREEQISKSRSPRSSFGMDVYHERPLALVFSSISSYLCVARTQALPSSLHGTLCDFDRQRFEPH